MYIDGECEVTNFPGALYHILWCWGILHEAIEP